MQSMKYRHNVTQHCEQLKFSLCSKHSSSYFCLCLKYFSFYFCDGVRVEYLYQMNDVISLYCGLMNDMTLNTFLKIMLWVCCIRIGIICLWLFTFLNYLFIFLCCKIYKPTLKNKIKVVKLRPLINYFYKTTVSTKKYLKFQWKMTFW